MQMCIKTGIWIGFYFNFQHYLKASAPIAAYYCRFSVSRRRKELEASRWHFWVHWSERAQIWKGVFFNFQHYFEEKKHKVFEISSVFSLRSCTCAFNLDFEIDSRELRFEKELNSKILLTQMCIKCAEPFK